jgi:CzcA family heavy metal efflux pump
MSIVIPPHKAEGDSSGAADPAAAAALSVAPDTAVVVVPSDITPAAQHRVVVQLQPTPGRNLVAVARPYFGLIVVTTLLLVAWGIVAMLNMPSGIYPEVSFPQIAVIVETPALGIRDVETVITRPIEERVSIVPGVSRLQSKTVRGASEIKIDFAPGTDMIQALNDVRAKMAEIEAQLPAGTTAIVERQSPSVFPIISFVVTGGANPAALRDYAFYDLRPRIGRLDGVSYVEVQGGDLREIVVEIDPQRLIETGLSITDVADHLAKDHQLKAVGRLDRGSTQFQVLSDSQATDPLDLADRVVAVKNDQSIYLHDIGRAMVSHEDRSMAIRCNGEDAVSLTVFRRLGGNALAVSHELNDALAEARKTAPPGITITPVYDQGQLVRTAIDNVRDAMLIGGAMSVLVLLAFLKSVRATLIAALSIPLSLIISFGFLKLTGDTLNLMSLGGLAVAIGLIIDDTVVVIENIARHLATGQTGDAAVDAASKEISGAVVGSTLTTILVFVPLAFVHGVVGQFFHSLSIALSIALLVSMVVSLTIIPVLASRFLARRPMPSTGPIYNFLADGYEAMLRGGLKIPRLIIVLALAMVVPGWLLFRNLDSGFMPDMDEGAFILDYEMPVGTSLAQTDKILRRVEAVLQESPDISGYIRRTGAENGLFVTESFRGDILVSLKPPGQRRAMKEIFTSLEEDIKKSVPELESLELLPLIQDQLNDLAGLQRPIEIKVFGPDVVELRKLAEKVAAEAAALKLDEVNAHVHLGNPDLVVRPHSAQSSRLGLTVQDVENQLNAALFGQIVGTIPQRDRLTNIRVRYPDSVRYNREELDQLPICLPAGGTASAASNGQSANGSPAPQFVPLGQLASIELVRSPNEFWRENQQPVITVTAEQGGNDLGTINRQLQDRLSALKFPPGYRWELAGGYRAQQDSFASLLMVLVVASALVFLLLGFQFHSLTLPLLIFLTQPISLASAMFALWITKTPLNVSSFMGGILLIGLDVKNGIILIEYIGQLVRSGLPLEESLVLAGRTRFRPIVMTSLTTIFGLVPLALGLGPGAQMQQPLAIAVIGGLIANMLVTRLLIPVGYLALQRRTTSAGVMVADA